MVTFPARVKKSQKSPKEILKRGPNQCPLITSLTYQKYLCAGFSTKSCPGLHVTVHAIELVWRCRWQVSCPFRGASRFINFWQVSFSAAELLSLKNVPPTSGRSSETSSSRFALISCEEKGREGNRPLNLSWKEKAPASSALITELPNAASSRQHCPNQPASQVHPANFKH